MGNQLKNINLGLDYRKHESRAAEYRANFLGTLGGSSVTEIYTFLVQQLKTTIYLFKKMIFSCTYTRHYLHFYYNNLF